LLTAANKVTVWRADALGPIDDPTARIPAPLWWPPLVRLIVVVLLCGWLFVTYQGTPERVLIGAALGVVVVMELIGVLVPTRRRARPAISYPPPPTRATVEVDVDVLVLRLRDVLVMVDKLLDQATAERPAEPGLPIPDTLLDYLQELSAAHLTNDAGYALALARRVPSLLVPFDITLLTDAAQRNRFALVSSLDEQGDAPRVIRPALLRGNVTLRRGEIEIPRGSLE
jgi:hypothetical protein